MILYYFHRFAYTFLTDFSTLFAFILGKKDLLAELLVTQIGQSDNDRCFLFIYVPNFRFPEGKSSTALITFPAEGHTHYH